MTGGRGSRGCHPSGATSSPAGVARHPPRHRSWRVPQIAQTKWSTKSNE